MSKVCDICGSFTEDDNAQICPICRTPNKWSKNIAESELKKFSKDSSFLQAMIELKEKDPIEYELKLNQFKLQQEQSKQIDIQKQDSSNIVKCPKCGYTDIGVVNRGYSILWGLVGSGESKNVCKRCGYKWKPRYK